MKTDEVKTEGLCSANSADEEIQVKDTLNIESLPDNNETNEDEWDDSFDVFAPIRVKKVMPSTSNNSEKGCLKKRKNPFSEAPDSDDEFKKVLEISKQQNNSNGTTFSSSDDIFQKGAAAKKIKSIGGPILLRRSDEEREKIMSEKVAMVLLDDKENSYRPEPNLNREILSPALKQEQDEDVPVNGCLSPVQESPHQSEAIENGAISDASSRSKPDVFLESTQSDSSAHSNLTLPLGRESPNSIFSNETLDANDYNDDEPESHLKLADTNLINLELKCLQSLSEDSWKMYENFTWHMIKVLCSDGVIVLPSSLLLYRFPLIYEEVDDRTLNWQNYSKKTCDALFRYMVSGKIDHFNKTDQQCLLDIRKISRIYHLELLNSVIKYFLKQNKGDVSTDEDESHELSILQQSRKFFFKESRNDEPCVVIESDDSVIMVDERPSKKVPEVIMLSSGPEDESNSPEDHFASLNLEMTHLVNAVSEELDRVNSTPSLKEVKRMCRLKKKRRSSGSSSDSFEPNFLTPRSIRPDVTSELSDLCTTPGGQQFLVSETVEPKPNYELMTSLELEVELCKYGLKRNLGRRKGIMILDYIYKQLHPNENDPAVKNTLAIMKKSSEPVPSYDNRSYSPVAGPSRSYSPVPGPSGLCRMYRSPSISPPSSPPLHEQGLLRYRTYSSPFGSPKDRLSPSYDSNARTPKPPISPEVDDRPPSPSYESSPRFNLSPENHLLSNAKTPPRRPISPSDLDTPLRLPTKRSLDNLHRSPSRLSAARTPPSQNPFQMIKTEYISQADLRDLMADHDSNLSSQQSASPSYSPVFQPDSPHYRPDSPMDVTRSPSYAPYLPESINPTSPSYTPTELLDSPYPAPPTNAPSSALNFSYSFAEIPDGPSSPNVSTFQNKLSSPKHKPSSPTWLPTTYAPTSLQSSTTVPPASQPSPTHSSRLTPSTNTEFFVEGVPDTQHPSTSGLTERPISDEADKKSEFRLPEDEETGDNLNGLGPLTKKILGMINESGPIKTMVMLYRPVWFKRFKELLEEKGIHCSQKHLKDVLNHLSIPFKMDREEDKN